MSSMPPARTLESTAEKIQTIELLDTDDEADDEEVIDLAESDDDIEIIEAFCSSQDQALCITSISGAPDSSTETAAQEQPQDNLTQRQRRRRRQARSSLKSCQEQLDKQQQLLHQQQLKGKHILAMYVDGSYRSQVPKQMSGGFWVAGTLSEARILQGGRPDSFRAELGSIYAAMEYLSTRGLHTLIGVADEAAAQAMAGSIEVWMYSDCQACLDVVRNSNVKQKYRPLLDAIMQLKSQLPFRVRIFKVQGHSSAQDAHFEGNRIADRLARKCDKHDPVCQLPH